MARIEIHSVVTFTIQGKERGFRNDKYALLIASRKDGCSLNEMAQRAEAGDNLTIMNLMYALSASYHESRNMAMDFTVNDMPDWLDELGPEKVRDLILEVFKVPEQPKNSESPKETGVTVQ